MDDGTRPGLLSLLARASDGTLGALDGLRKVGMAKSWLRRARLQPPIKAYCTHGRHERVPQIQLHYLAKGIHT